MSTTDKGNNNHDRSPEIPENIWDLSDESGTLRVNFTFSTELSHLFGDIASLELEIKKPEENDEQISYDIRVVERRAKKAPPPPQDSESLW